MLYIVVTGRTPQQNSDKDFVAVENPDDDSSILVEINNPLDFEETSQYTLLLRASVS